MTNCSAANFYVFSQGRVLHLMRAVNPSPGSILVATRCCIGTVCIRRCVAIGNNCVYISNWLNTTNCND